MIRKTLTAVGAALALTAGLAAPAFAAADHNIVTNSVFFVNMEFGDGFDTFGDFGDGPLAQGTKVDDVFLFFAPPTPYSLIEFYGSADKNASHQNTFKFTGFDYGVLNYELTDADFNVTGINGTSYAMDDASFNNIAFNGTGHDWVGSGIYYIEVKGTVTRANGGFSGSVFTTAVPEPTNIALMLAGIGLVGTMARRRKQQA